MLAARFKKSGTPLLVEDVEVPSIDPYDVLVRVKAAGICGTDVHYRMGDASPEKVPLTLGHEGAGVVEKTGSKVTHLEEGDNVIIHYLISCGNCVPCLRGFDNQCRYRKTVGHDVDGTFAKYIKIPARNALEIADHVPLEWGAVAACAVSTSLHALNVSGLKKGESALIFGVGGVGLHAVMWAQRFGAGKIIAADLVDSKLETAQKYGADRVVNPLKEDILRVVEEETDGWGVDVVVECSGSSKAMEQGLKAIKGKNKWRTGRVVSVGAQINPFRVEYWNLREGMLTVSGDHTRYELQQIITLMETGKVNLSDSISHRISLREINKGINLLKDGEEHVQRIVIDMDKK